MKCAKQKDTGTGKKKDQSIQETDVVSEKEPFIQHCFYSNVFKGESKERID